MKFVERGGEGGEVGKFEGDRVHHVYVWMGVMGFPYMISLYIVVIFS